MRTKSWIKSFQTWTKCYSLIFSQIDTHTSILFVVVNGNLNLKAISFCNQAFIIYLEFCKVFVKSALKDCASPCEREREQYSFNVHMHVDNNVIKPYITLTSSFFFVRWQLMGYHIISLVSGALMEAVWSARQTM